MVNVLAVRYLAMGRRALGLRITCERILLYKKRKKVPGTKPYDDKSFEEDRKRVASLGQAIEDWINQSQEPSEYSSLLEPSEAIDLTFEMIKKHYPAERVKYSREGLTEDDLYLIRALEACPAESSLRDLSGLLKKFATDSAKINIPQIKKLMEFFKDWHDMAAEKAANA